MDADFSGYQSPVDLIVDQVMDRLDQEIENAVNLTLNYEIKVNKEEMIKALQYDRDQYRIGYEQGKKHAVGHGHWKKVNDKYPRYVCTICNHLFNNKGYKFCPNCGARMDEEVNKNAEVH